MSSPEIHLAQSWAHLRCETPQLCFYDAQMHGCEHLFRHALRDAGVPILELNGATALATQDWIDAARNLSQEFLVPVVIFGRPDDLNHINNLPKGQFVHEIGWLTARQSALMAAVECSDLNQEFRRTSDKSGWMRLGWHHPDELAVGNGLLLAWTSPLPLMRIRNFSARCSSQLQIEGPDAETLASDVAGQGISVSHWQFAVK